MTKALNTSADHSSRQTRREFCACACQAASLLAVGALAGCGGSSNPSGPSNVPTLSVVPSTVSGRVISITVDGSPIAAVGTAAMVQQTGLGIFLVAHTGQDTFTALTSVCTHEGCTVTGFDNSRYVCPCHGSQYSTSGNVVQGPATRSLQSFPTQFANGVLTITV